MTTIAAATRSSTVDPPSPGRAVLSEEAWREVAMALRLSSRESEILKAVFDDRKELAIACDLGISVHTVHSHLERLYRKLRVSSRVALVVRVFAEHLARQR